MQQNKVSHYFLNPFPIFDFHEDYLLREQELSDASNFLFYYNDPVVSQYILAEIPTTLTDAENEIRYCRSLFYKQTGLYWSLARKPSDQMIGAIGYYLKSQYEAEICFDLHKKHWGLGIMSAALTPAIQFGRELMGLRCISAITLAANLASCRLLKKHGFHHEKTLYQHRYFNGQLYNVERYTLNFE